MNKSFGKCQEEIKWCLVSLVPNYENWLKFKSVLSGCYQTMLICLFALACLRNCYMFNWKIIFPDCCCMSSRRYVINQTIRTSKLYLVGLGCSMHSCLLFINVLMKINKLTNYNSDKKCSYIIAT